MQHLAGKVAVITGAGSGIGAALAHACGREGMRVVVADVERDAAERTAAELRAGGADAFGFRADVRERTQLDALADACYARFGACHLLVNNAGVLVTKPIAELATQDWEWVLSVNLWGVVHGVAAFLPRMRAQGGEAHIVNTASMAGLAVFPGMGLGAYGASKYAVVGLSEVLRDELAGSGIGVSVLCPGGVATRIHESHRNRPAELAAGAPPPRRETAELNARPDVHAPEAVAAAVLEGVRANALFIATHPELREMLEARHQQLAAAFDAAEKRAARLEAASPRA